MHYDVCLEGEKKESQTVADIHQDLNSGIRMWPDNVDISAYVMSVLINYVICDSCNQFPLQSARSFLINRYPLVPSFLWPFGSHFLMRKLFLAYLEFLDLTIALVSHS